MEEQDWMKSEAEQLVDKLGEAPHVAFVDVYIDGFHVSRTFRHYNPAVVDQQLEEFVSMAKQKGWKPSWNTQTNQEFSQPQKPVSSQPSESEGGCRHENTEIKVSSGGKNPANAGKKYKVCLDCKKFISWA